MIKYSLDDFNKRFPDDNVCLERLKNKRYPNGIYCTNCSKVTKHHKVKSRPSYSCDCCGHHVHPKAGTMFAKSTTPLRYWFYAMYLISITRCNITAAQLQAELGVTYKTAWRMFHMASEVYFHKQKWMGKN